MLPPDSRSLLVDSLRPPPGAALDRAVATTFSLDLVTALTVPLAFVGFSPSTAPDPIAMLEAVRSTASRLDIFCQAGMVNAPSWPSDLVALLEGVVHTVNRPRPGHLFHPKLWVVRYRNDVGELSYRCLVLSRNLTGDSSWDVILRLDSDPDSTRVNADNTDLVRMIDALPGLAGAPLLDDRREQIEALAEEVRRVAWLPPDDVSDIRFIAFGLPNRRNPNTAELFRGYKHLLISPFITEDGIETLCSDQATDLTIIARPESLDCLPKGALDDTCTLVINPLASLAEAGDENAEAAALPSFGALHAKTYVIEANRRAYVYVGSANATGAAFGGNVEILCELTGSATRLGVAAMIGDNADFREMLEPYTPPDEPTSDRVADATWKLEQFLVDVAEARFRARCIETPDGWEEHVASSGTLPAAAFASGLQLTIAPYIRPNDTRQLQPDTPVDVTFGARPVFELTPFLLVAASATIDEQPIERKIVVVAELEGAPPTRVDDILIRQLDSSEKFMRFLVLLLALGSGQHVAGTSLASTNGGAWNFSGNSAVFELLVRALATSPESIDRLQSVVDRLRVSDLAASVLPPEWDIVWDCVVSARQLMARSAL